MGGVGDCVTRRLEPGRLLRYQSALPIPRNPYCPFNTPLPTISSNRSLGDVPSHPVIQTIVTRTVWQDKVRLSGVGEGY